MKRILLVPFVLITLLATFLQAQTIYGDTAYWEGGDVASCLLSEFDSLPLTVTIPANCVPEHFAIQASYYTLNGANITNAKLYFTTDCGRYPENGRYITGSNLSTGHGYFNFLSAITPFDTLVKCFLPSCFTQTFKLTMYLSRDTLGSDCNETYVYYDHSFYYPFGAFISGTYSECTGVESLSSDNSLIIYPSPVETTLGIENAGLKIFKIDIYNMLGQLQEELIPSSKPEIDVSALSSGIYFLRIQTEYGNTVRKFLKE